MMSVKSFRRKWEQEKAERKQFERTCINTRLVPNGDGTYTKVLWTYQDGDLI